MHQKDFFAPVTSPSPTHVPPEPIGQLQANPSNPQVLFAWKAPLRPFVKRSPQVVRFYLALALLLSLIVVFFGDWILLLPIWTVLFLFYVLTITPPPDVEHRITQFGVESAGTKLPWDTLLNFHFDKRLGYEILTVVTQPPYFDHFYMLVPSEETKKRVTELLSPHIEYEDDPHKSFTDKLIMWLSKLVPQEE